MKIDPLVFHAKFPKYCDLEKCKSRCCKGGVWADLREKEVILKNAELFLPFLLGNRLPIKIKRRLAADLKARHFMRAFGVATESPDSLFYTMTAAWRGRVRAPSTLFLAKALEECGEPSLAASLATQFLNLCSDGVFAESFDPDTGKALGSNPSSRAVSLYLYFAAIAR